MKKITAGIKDCMNWSKLSSRLALGVCASLTVAACCTGCVHDQENYPPETLEAFGRIDSIMNIHDRIIADKEYQLSQMRSLKRDLDDRALIGLYHRMFEAYYSYDFDSAAYYARLKYDTALRVGDRHAMAEAKVNIAKTELALGNEIAAMDSLKSVAENDTALYADIKKGYYDVLANHLFSQGECADKEFQWLIDNSNQQGTGVIYHRVALLRSQGRNREALEFITEKRPRLTRDVHGTAVADFVTSQIHLALGDTTSATLMLANSSIHDLMSPVRDYTSLYQLSSILFGNGDVDRAYRYLTFATKDHYASNVSNNLVAINHMMPFIISAHDKRNQQRRHLQEGLTIGIAILAVALLIVLGILYQQLRKASSANRAKSLLNERLIIASKRLKSLNQTLSQSNDTKDAYILQYLNLCSYYIESIERYRNNLRSIARTKGVKEMLDYLNSSNLRDRELKEFYHSFDTTFLKLFPDFVERFNELIETDKRLVMPGPDTLSTEMRVFALMRLGITESERIATFLRRSTSTIYNYRVKMRNAALGDRDKFEEEVMKIGQSTAR